MPCRRNRGNWRLHDDYLEDPGDLIACIVHVGSRGRPATHKKGSVLWRTICGEGFVMFQYNPSGAWILGYLAEGDSWLARPGYPYYFIPQLKPFELEAFCYRDDAFGKRLTYFPAVPLPQEAYIFVCGRVIEVGEDYLELTRREIPMKYQLTEEDDPDILTYREEDEADFHQEVNLRRFFGERIPRREPISILRTPSWQELDEEMSGYWPYDEEELPEGGGRLPREHLRHVVVEAVRQIRL